MKRFRTKNPFQKNIKATKTFLFRNSSILVLLCLLIAGVILGVSVFRALAEPDQRLVGEFLYKSPQSIDWQNAAATITASCIRHTFVLVVLLLFGLTAFGCPLILCAVLLCGFRIGVILSISYLSNGMWYMIAAVYPPILLVGIATLLAARRSLQMSCVYSCQLLPYGAHCGGLWSEFKHYLLSYVICFGLTVSASFAECLLQILISMM